MANMKENSKRERTKRDYIRNVKIHEPYI